MPQRSPSRPGASTSAIAVSRAASSCWRVGRQGVPEEAVGTGSLLLRRPLPAHEASVALSRPGGQWRPRIGVLVASDGGIFTYGDATFQGSAGGAPLNKPIAGMPVGP